MVAFTLFDIEGARNAEMKPRVSNIAVEITRSCRLTLKWDEMFARYVITLSRFKLEGQLCFTAKVNIIHIQRLHDGLDALVKYIEDSDLNQSIKKCVFVILSSDMLIAKKILHSLLVFNR